MGIPSWTQSPGIRSELPLIRLRIALLHLLTCLPHKAGDLIASAFCCIYSETGPGTLHVLQAAFVKKISEQTTDNLDVKAEMWLLGRQVVQGRAAL